MNDSPKSPREDLTQRLIDNLPFWLEMVNERRQPDVTPFTLTSDGHDPGDEDPQAWSEA